MPEIDGLGILRAVRERDLDLPVVLMTGDPTIDSATQAVEYGAFRYLVKPLDVALLTQTLERAAHLHKVARVRRQTLAKITDTAALPSDRAGLEATFSRTLETLWAAFQPIVQDRDDVVAHEVLLRSREPALPSPPAVLDAAEKLGKLALLGKTVRERAVAAIPSAPPQWLFFVNLHPTELIDSELCGDGPLSGYEQRIVLEITERASLEGMPNLQERIAELRSRGFRIALDDLGAGYAGLSTFAKLEPDFVKIDMSLVRDVDKYPTKRTMVAAVAAICIDMGIRCIAEGIETAAEREVLLEVGSDWFQGYLIAKPGEPFPEPSGN
jgi:EAL domain-containing protein (putative c-di-GMP-specific phosphodiesterase class I)